MHVVASHCAQQRKGAAEVVLVVLEGLGHRLADGLEPREVDRGVDVLVVEELLRLVDVGEVEGVDRYVDAGQGLESADDRRLGVAEIIDDNDVVSCFDESDHGV